MRASLPRQAYEVFSRAQKVLQRSRAALDPKASRTVDYVRDEVARRVISRLAFVTRRFDNVVDLGSGAGSLERAMLEPIPEADNETQASKFGRITMVDSCKALLYRDADLDFNNKLQLKRLVADEESFFMGENTLDAVISSMSLHWINDLPGVLKRVETMLKPDGMFLASMLGGESLFELRTSLQIAEMERYGRVSPRMSPLADFKDMGALMQQAGFKMLTIDVEEIVVGYPDMFALMEDLKSAGESNAIAARPETISRELLLAANSIYQEMHGDDNGVPATFRIVNMIGWKFSPNQPQPLARGSGEIKLREALKDGKFKLDIDEIRTD